MRHKLIHFFRHYGRVCYLHREAANDIQVRKTLTYTTPPLISPLSSGSDKTWKQREEYLFIDLEDSQKVIVIVKPIAHLLLLSLFPSFIIRYSLIALWFSTPFPTGVSKEQTAASSRTPHCTCSIGLQELKCAVFTANWQTCRLRSQ